MCRNDRLFGVKKCSELGLVCCKSNEMLLFVHYLAHLICLHMWRYYLITQFDGYHGLEVLFLLHRTINRTLPGLAAPRIEKICRKSRTWTNSSSYYQYSLWMDSGWWSRSSFEELLVNCRNLRSHIPKLLWSNTLDIFQFYHKCMIISVEWWLTVAEIELIICCNHIRECFSIVQDEYALTADSYS